MKLNIPEQIKVKLVDDWETVTKDNKVSAVIALYLRLFIRFTSW
jgi:hypothetical protein